MAKDAFGFDDTRRPSTAEKLRQFQPSSGPPPDTPLDRIDAIGEAHGFVARQTATRPPPPRRREIGPTLALNMRAPERVAHPFIRFCMENRFSYWEGIEEMMKRCGIAD
jgi:hypothetical protein